MATAKLGNISLEQPLGIGTLQWGTTWIDDKMVKGGCIMDSAIEAIVNEFLRAGVTFFDSAEGYGGGTSEDRLGRATMGSQVALATKFLPTFWRCTHGALRKAALRSRAELRVPRIPLYFIHTPIHWKPIEFWIEAACDAKDEGLIENIGVSNFDADQIRRAHAAATRRGYSIAANQIMFGLLNYQSLQLRETVRACKELGITIVAYSPIGQGLLTDKFSEDTFKENRVAIMTGVKLEELERLRVEMASIALETGKSMAQVALNWVICHGCVPLVGCRTLEQAKDTIGCLDWRLNEDQLRRLDGVALGHSTLTGKMWKRVFFANMFGIVMICCRLLRWIKGLTSLRPHGTDERSIVSFGHQR
eukprot:CAMPEP_0117529072 /NCGR_PEP_ID=MMETSP0784-20121206/37644_1 /TAXON_ID=39447 /ORGANISM="" /LENGTH=361 /DNA_ID=CAMNT_0005325383 /DNA_START=50 /DNA_END=1136 /DNA_ORIENTATION=+